MEQINIEKLLQKKTSKFNSYPKLLRKIIIKILEKMFHLKEVNLFIEKNSSYTNIGFIDKLFAYLDYAYILSPKDRAKIPATGRLVITSNHPLGGMDGLALLRAVYEIRNDVKILANDVLLNVDNLKQLFLPVDVYTRKTAKTYLNAIGDALNNEEALIFFPASKVSRFTKKGIKDKRWNKGAIKFATKYNAPILPVFSQAKNSFMFYFLSTIFDKYASLFLPHELFNKKDKHIKFFVGDTIPVINIKSKTLKPQYIIDLLYQHTYHLRKGKNEIFLTEHNIISSIDPRLLQRELKEKAELIGFTQGAEQIYLVKYDEAPNVMQEIGRLRELTFRAVGEGSGKSVDLDKYDKYYDHIVLWSNDDLEIMGAYRLGYSKSIYDEYGFKGFYNAQSFIFNDDFKEISDYAIEFGRSFIQRKYWRTSALDYLWNGIAIYLNRKTNVRYLWGGVSLSDTFSDYAKFLIISYYKKWYGGDKEFVVAKNEETITRKKYDDIDDVLTGVTAKIDFRNLKKVLKTMGYSVPALFRRYSEMTIDNGTKFYSFGTNDGLNGATDGLMIIDMEKIRPELQERYFNAKGFVKVRRTLY